MSSKGSGCDIDAFELAEIRKITNTFDKDRIIRKGESGVTYKGILDDGQIVAVKRLEKEMNLADQFRNEIEILSEFPSEYVVSLLGYCDDSDELILVHEFMHEGTLEDKLFNSATTSLSWEQRLKICIDTAKGLEYLHNCIAQTERIIHRNLKPANILIDKNWTAKISDFGCAKTTPANQTNTAVRTRMITSVYLDPNYQFTGELTTRTDVYAFGVVMFEVLCGRPAPFDKRPPQKLRDWAQQCITNQTLGQFIDPRLEGQISEDCLKEFADIANNCLLVSPGSRLKLPEVVERLESVLKKCRKTPSVSKPATPRPNEDANNPKSVVRSPGSCSGSGSGSTSKLYLSGTGDKIVLYCTSSGIIRKTAEDCRLVQLILEEYGVNVEKRDVMTKDSYRSQLKGVFGENKMVNLPQLFVRGNHIGGADEIKRLHAGGDLKKLF